MINAEDAKNISLTKYDEAVLQKIETQIKEAIQYGENHITYISDNSTNITPGLIKVLTENGYRVKYNFMDKFWNQIRIYWGDKK